MIGLKDEGIYSRNIVQKNATIQEFVAVNDTFGESAIPAELMKKYGIVSDAVQAAVKRIMKR